jgi:hypothetical protein
MAEIIIRIPLPPSITNVKEIANSVDIEYDDCKDSDEDDSDEDGSDEDESDEDDSDEDER